MPRKLPTPCRHPGCPALTVERFCDTHARAHANDARSRADVNAVVAQRREFYKSPAWRKLRARVLSCAPFCRCGARASVVDHVTRIADGGAPLDPANLQTMCWTCHQAKRQAESLQARGVSRDTPERLLPPHARRRGR